MKDISVILFDASVLGGIQLMTIDTIGLLSKNGYNVTFVTMKVSDRIVNYLKRYDLKNVKIKLLLKISNITLQMLYSRLFYSEKDFSINMHGDIQPIASDIVYFHQFNIDYRIRSPFKEKLILIPQYLIRKGFMEKIRKEEKLVLVNSRWTKAEAKYFWNINAEILYPPVHVEWFRNINNLDRDNTVITISRFSRDRGLDNIIKIAKELEDYNFIIAGYLQDQEYFNEIKNKKTKNIQLYPNIDETTKIKLLSSSKVYFNPTPYIEGFGTSVVEGMSAGLIPVTRNKGGVIDFVPEKYTFNEFTDAMDKVKRAMEDWNEKEMKEMKNISERFSLENYEKNLLNIINKFF
ncbi:glycosyltransferase family 4 protein [Sulfuracidifex metallicus]|uniref:Glycosyltransferase n=1 Tax=Sulfuracidifex metallicus DSM 6482 = JCM 9184 TaxID=523847 RepID=A0A6A9QJR1_SULME|nr:glycosyltransferase family 4 protein [Sulfuracidifex metallicus]MUN28490.1 glycosyltransferase [Sulfuracidifex metallicus DSM 6482 = JCM 9184]WOE50979.1 glycosyltransferase family 4 protein [Sulfuracidifex metallicus DSM 6482 = JCM 9184]